MGFLDNSGDIILDAVLTDEGRRRLAKGTFNVDSFALGDDEIDYSLYRNENHVDGPHPTGPGYHDLEILQTPILEAFTDAGSSLKSALVTYGNNGKLYLPVMILNTLASNNNMASGLGLYHVTVTKDTSDVFQRLDGTLKGDSQEGGNSSIRLDQGLDSELLEPSSPIPTEDIETIYNVYMDNRMGSFAGPDGALVSVNFIDDDDIAKYTITLDGTEGIVTSNTQTLPVTSEEVIRGPRGTKLNFKIRSSNRLRESNTLFNNIGSTGTLDSFEGASTAIRFIDTVVRVVGATTGYKIDVPIRYIKKLDE
jgi:hypothetical protein